VRRTMVAGSENWDMQDPGFRKSAVPEAVGLYGEPWFVRQWRRFRGGHARDWTIKNGRHRAWFSSHNPLLDDTNES